MLDFHLGLKNLKKERAYSRSEGFWETLSNIASGEYISWLLSLERRVCLQGIGEENPLSFLSSYLFLDLQG